MVLQELKIKNVSWMGARFAVLLFAVCDCLSKVMESVVMSARTSMIAA